MNNFLTNYCLLDFHKFIVKNSDGEVVKLPNVANGIDSICLKNAPFLEYTDDNGLRRVVALFNDDLYYYGDEAGTHDGTRQFVLAQWRLHSFHVQRRLHSDLQ